MKLIELLGVIDDTNHVNQVWIGVRHGEFDMSVGSAFSVLGNFCTTNKLSIDAVGNAEVLGIDTGLSPWSFGTNDDPDKSNTYTFGFDIKPDLTIWIDPKGLK